MNGIIKNCFLAASVMASIGAIGSTPAFAASLANIQFFGPSNPRGYRTYTGTSSGSFIPNNSGVAQTALTGNVAGSNVELWYTDENPTGYVGFTADLGNSKVKVTNILTADWSANVGGGKTLAEQWVDDLLAFYANSPITLTASEKTAGIQKLQQAGLPRAHDPNIDYFTENNGVFELGLLGHFNLAQSILSGYTTGINALDTKLLQAAQLSQITNVPIQMSEIAKVEIDGKVKYAYGFQATPSGITTNNVDSTDSYTGLYKIQWNADPATSKSVPEPSAILGLVAVGGLVAAKRKLKKA